MVGSGAEAGDAATPIRIPATGDVANRDADNQTMVSTEGVRTRFRSCTCRREGPGLNEE